MKHRIDRLDGVWNINAGWVSGNGALHTIICNAAPEYTGKYLTPISEFNYAVALVLLSFISRGVINYED